MAILDKRILGFTGAVAQPSDSPKAREFVKDTYRKAGGRPTPALERVYGEYLNYKRIKKARTPKD
jgi:hypothetical protein